MGSNEPQPMLSTPTSSHSSSQHNDTLFDFDFDPFVDEDDPGFNIDSDTDPDNLSTVDATSDAANDGAYDSDHDSDSILTTTTTKHLYDLTTLLQLEFQSQPKSTQLILTHEVAQLFKSYEQHGSAVRLSASIMAYLDSGDEVFRPAVHLTEIDELDALGRVVGRREVEKKVIEKATLKFQEIPVVAGSTRPMGGTSSGQHAGRGKRKAEDEEVKRSVSQERRRGPVGGFGDTNWIEFAGHSRSIFDDDGSLTRPKTAGKVFPGEMVDAMNKNGPANDDFRGLLNRPGPQHQQSSRGVTDTQPRIAEHERDLQYIPDQPHPSPLQPPSLTPTPLTDPRLYHLYSLTTDPETQSLLIGPDPVIPFRPLADLKIAIPLRPQPQPQQQPHTQNTTPYPADLIPTTTRVLHLHNLSAQRFYNSLIQKYTLLPLLPPTTTPATPPPPPRPQPPAALFRLGITALLHHTLQHTFQPMLEHQFAMAPPVRRLLKDLYANTEVEMHDAGNGHGDADEGEEVVASTAPLNLVESTLIAKAAGVDEVSVEAWWKEVGKGLAAWTAVCGWVERREGEAIRVAREGGWF